MYKEAILTILIFILLFVLLRILLKKKPQAFRVATILLLSVCTIANIVFTVSHYLPTFVLDQTTPLGDAEENLFLYKSDSEYNETILFPILEDRMVYLDIGDASQIYQHFFETYASQVEPVLLTNNQKKALTKDVAVYQLCKEFTFFRLLDYAFPENDAYTDQLHPLLYVNTEALDMNSSLVAFASDPYTLYLLPLSEYAALTGDTTLPFGGQS